MTDQIRNSNEESRWKMFGGIISGLLCAWILAQFDVDNICINVLQPFTQIKLTTDHFYFVFGLVGFVCGAIHDIFN